MASFDFKKLTARAFSDYIGPPFPEWWNKNESRYRLPDLRNINADQLKGGKYFMQMKLRTPSGDIYTLPNEPIISLNLVKTIVETPTIGKKRKGTVKEYITTEDWSIGIVGVCFIPGEPEVYPAEEVSLLNELYDIDEALEIVDNPFFELFGIRKLVLKNFSLDEMIGEPGAQRYSFEAVSDEDFFAIINK